MISELRKEISNFFDINDNKIIFFERAFMSLFCLFKFLSKQSKRKKILFTSSTCQSPVLACYFANLKPISPETPVIKIVFLVINSFLFIIII